MRFYFCISALLATVIISFGSNALAGDDGSSYAIFGRGMVGQFWWESWAERSVFPSKGLGQPCVSIYTREPLTSRDARVDETNQCGAVTTTSPLVQSVSNGRSGRKRRTVVSMAFASSARRVALDLGFRGERFIDLKRLSDKKAQRLRIVPLSYWSAAFGGAFCLRRFITYDGHDVQLSDSGVIPCK